MPRTFVDTWFVKGALDAETVAQRIGEDRAILATSLVCENSRAAARRIYQKSDGLGVFFAHFYTNRDRLRGLPSVMWRDRDVQYVEDIKAIRTAIVAITGEDEATAFPTVNDGFLRRFDIPSDAELFPFDCSLRAGEFSEAVRSLSDALNEQIAEFMASRFKTGAVEVATMVFRAEVN